MSRQSARPQGVLSRFWSFMLTTSETAVRVHYHKPWHDDVPAKAGKVERQVAEITAKEAVSA